jgi:hypothetical protein
MVSGANPVGRGMIREHRKELEAARLQINLGEVMSQLFL